MTSGCFNTIIEKIKIKTISEAARSGVAFAVSSIITKGLLFLTIPIFVRIMSSEQIGVVSIYNSWFMIIGTVTSLSLTSGGYQRALLAFSEEKDQYDSSVLALSSIMPVIFFFIYLGLRDVINPMINIPNSLVFLMLFGILVNPAYEIWMSRQRFEYKYKVPFFVSIFTAFCATGLSVLVVLYLNSIGNSSTAVGRLFSNNIVVYGVALLFWVSIIVKGKTIFHKAYWSYSLSISIPLMAHVLAKQVLDLSDRQMISKMVGNREVGIYSTLYSLCALTTIIWNAINTSYIPYLYKNIGNEYKKQDIRKSSFQLLVIYYMIVVFIVYLAPEIVRIFLTKEYYAEIYIMPPIALGVSMVATANMYSNVLVYYKKSMYIMIASITAAIINLAGNYVFIPVYGYEVAAYTTLIAYILFAMIEACVATHIYKQINKTTKMVYANGNIVMLMVVMFFSAVGGIFTYSSLGLRIVLMIGIECVLLYWGIVSGNRSEKV